MSVCHLLTFCFAKNNITDKRRTWPGFGSSRRAEGHFGKTVRSTAYQLKCFIYLFYLFFFGGGGGELFHMAYFQRGLFPSPLDRSIEMNLACASCSRYKISYYLEL